MLVKPLLINTKIEGETVMSSQIQTYENENALRDQHIGLVGPRPRNNFTYAYDTDLWYSPKIEIIYAGHFLVEPGELFKFKQNYMNDDLMVALGQVLRYNNTKANQRNKRKCLNCCKVFVNYKYDALHSLVGCGRTGADKNFYEWALEELEEQGVIRNPSMDALRY